ncbi:MAG: maleylpyruvate isomerase family mycothiol-dependent enzyme [Actinomycetota bacterium]
MDRRRRDARRRRRLSEHDLAALSGGGNYRSPDALSGRHGSGDPVSDVSPADTPSLIYARGREAVSDVVRSLDSAALAAPVAACPGWTVHDVVAHLTGVATDAVNGVGPGHPIAPTMVEWTSRHVDDRRAQATTVVLREWERSASQLEVMLAKDDSPMPAVVMDLLCHEQDLRAATGRPGRRDTPGITIGSDLMAQRWASMIRSSRGASISLIDDDADVWAGDAESSVTFRADRFEFFRTTFGRRSRAQAERRLSGTDEPDAYLQHLFVFGPAEHDLAE